MPVAPAYNWTGFYIFGGGGGGMWAADQHVDVTGLAFRSPSISARVADGWFGTVGVGYDWQVNATWVAGVFADGQFGSIKGTLRRGRSRQARRQDKDGDSWAAGVRVGYLVAPNVLSYVNGGYSGRIFRARPSAAITSRRSPMRPHTDSFNRNGWFVGGGVENNLNIFGITARAGS